MEDAAADRELMNRLGYARYVAQGGNGGAAPDARRASWRSPQLNLFRNVPLDVTAALLIWRME